MADVFISYDREDRETAHGWSSLWDGKITAGL